MGCISSVHSLPFGRFCRGTNTSGEHSPPYSSNHLLLSGLESTTQCTPSKTILDNGDTPESQQNRPLLPRILRLTKGHTKALLVFAKEDTLCSAWSSNCKKRGYEVFILGSPDEVLKAHLEQCFDLILVDLRSSTFLKKIESLSEALRNSEDCASCVLTALVKEKFWKRNSARIQSILNSGFSKILTESSCPITLWGDLLLIERTELLLQDQFRTLKALYSALDSCKDIIHITDTHHKIQYINQACETQLGYTIDELSGKTIWEVHGSDHHRQDLRTPTPVEGKLEDLLPSVENIKNLDVSKEMKVNLDISEAVNLQMRRGKDWEGIVSCRRKSGDVISLASKVTPVALQPKRTEFYVYVSDGQHAGERMDYYHTKGSIKSIRKGSYDIRSLPSSEGSIIRRQSVAKLHSVMLEAPITRVVNIITAAQTSSPAYIAQALDKVLEILQSAELYNPQLIQDPQHSKVVSTADPVATDLLGALLSHAAKPLSASSSSIARRSSHEQISKASSSTYSSQSTLNPRPSLPNLQQQASAAIMEVLARQLTWDFDIIRLERLTDKKPLVWLGMSLMCHLDVPGTLSCDEQTLQNWLTLIEANYISTNSYHTSTHAADVLQATAHFLQLGNIGKLFGPLEAAACLIAATVHDVDHPGKNSQFLCNTNNELAILYNDMCVLESHHSAVTFKLTCSDDRVNILKGLDRDSFQFMRKNVIDMVLATDMAKHFEHVNKFINLLEKRAPDELQQEGATALDFSTVPENLQIVKRMLIKCADISNPLRPLELCKDWAHRIANEYFNQTEEEKRRRIPVVMPQFDRFTCSIPKSQIGFIDFFICDTFEAWNELAHTPVLMEHLQNNYQYWKDQDEAEQEKEKITKSLIPESLPEENTEDLTIEEIS